MGIIKKLKLSRNPHALIDAIKDNPDITADEVRDWLKSGAKINLQDEWLLTALNVAAQQGASPGVIQVLLENGADPNLKDCHGYTPLSWWSSYFTYTSRGSAPEVIAELSAHGADFCLIEDKFVHEKVIAILDEIEQEKRLQEFSEMKKTLLKSYNGNYSSIADNSASVVIGEFLGLTQEDLKSLDEVHRSKISI